MTGVLEQAAAKEREEERAEAVVAGEITAEQAADQEEEEKAARRIQSMQRGKLARREVGQMRADQQQQSEQQEEEEMEGAAVRIQAVHRGKAARKEQTDAQKRTADERAQVQRQVKNQMAVPSDHAALAAKLDGRLESLETDTWVAQQEDEMEREDAWRAEQEQAAVRIQSIQRGKQARRELDGGGGGLMVNVDSDGMEGMMDESEMSPPAEPWPDGRSPIPQKSRLPLPAGGHALPKPHSKVRFGVTSPSPVAPTTLRSTPPNGGRELQMRRGGGLAPLGSELLSEPDYNADPFVSALNTKRVKIEQQVRALQSRIIEQNLGGGGVDLEAMDGGAGILEEVKVFGALNAQMEQLVSLENEFLRGAWRLLLFGGSQLSSAASVSVGALLEIPRAWADRVSCLYFDHAQRSTSRRSCCWRGTWPPPTPSRRRLSSSRSPAAMTATMMTAITNATTSGTRSPLTGRTTEAVAAAARRSRTARCRTHRTAGTAAAHGGTQAESRTCRWGRAARAR